MQLTMTKLKNITMSLQIITILMFGIVLQTHSQDIKLRTKQTKNQNSMGKGDVSKFEKDSLMVFYAPNGIDTASICWYTGGKPSRIWTIYDDRCGVRYKFDYSRYDVVEYNWHETSNEFPTFNDTVWTVSDIDSPPLIVGIENPEQLIARNLRYPMKAFEKGISGRVWISFIVEKDGSACNFKVIKGVVKDIDAEALRVTRILDKNWFPAKKDGKAITIEYFISINFRLI